MNRDRAVVTILFATIIIISVVLAHTFMSRKVSWPACDACGEPRMANACESKLVFLQEYQDEVWEDILWVVYCHRRVGHSGFQHVSTSLTWPDEISAVEYQRVPDGS